MHNPSAEQPSGRAPGQAPKAIEWPDSYQSSPPLRRISLSIAEQHYCCDERRQLPQRYRLLPLPYSCEHVVMAPYLDDQPLEPVDEALETPLKAKPQLVAPEPGKFDALPLRDTD